MAGEIARAFVRVVPNSSGFQSSLERQTAGVGKSVGGKIGKAMAVGIAGGLAVVGGGLVAATKLAVDFDRSMRNVNSIAKLNEKDFGDLNKRVLELGKTAGVAPKTLADGLYDVVSSGFKANDAMKILTAGATAAKAGLTDTATATGAVTAVLNAYHLSAESAGQVSDALFQTVNVGVVNFEQLASTIGDVLPFASSLGINIQNVGGAIATMTKEGISAAETVTRIKAVMTQFLSPSKDLAARFKELGFESGEAMIKSKGFQGSLDLLAKSTHGSKSEMAKLFPDVRALGGALALTGDNAKGANADLIALAKSQGATAAAAKEQAKSISAQWDKAVGRLQASAITLGTQVFPVISTGIQLFSDLADAVGEFAAKPTIKLKAEFVLDEITSAAASIRDTITGALDDALNGQSFTPTGTFNNAVGMVSTDGLLAKIDQIDWGAVGGKIASGIETALATTSDVWGTMIDGLTAAVDSHQGQIANAGAQIGLGIISALLDPSFWLDNWQLILGIAIAIFPVGRFAGLGLKLASVFRGFGPLIARGFEEGLLAVGITVERFGGRLGGWLVEAIAAGARAVVFVAKGLGQGIADLVGSGVSGVKGIVGRILKVGVVAAIVGAVGSAVSAAVSLGGRIVSGVGQGLATLFSAVVNAMASVANAVTNAVSGAVSAAVSLGSAIVSGIVAGVRSAGGSLISALEGLASSALSAAKRKLGIGSPSRVFADEVGAEMVMGMVVGIKKKAPTLKATLNQATKEALASAKQNLNSMAGGIGDAIGQILDAQIQKQLVPLQEQLAGSQRASAAAQAARKAADSAASRSSLVSQLGGAFQNNESPAEYLKRQEDIRQQIAAFDAQAAQDAADAQQAAEEQALQDRIDAIGKEADARKAAISQSINDLSAMFTAGKISGKQFTSALTKILADNKVSIAAAGDLLGFAFAQQFAAQIKGVTQQIGAIAAVIGLRGGGAGGAGFNLDVNNPLDVIRSQLKDARAALAQDQKDLRAAKKTKDTKDDARERTAIERDRKMIAALDKILRAALAQPGAGTIIVGGAGATPTVESILADITGAAVR